MRVVKHDAEVERLGAQRDGGPDAAEAYNSEGLGPEALDQRMLERAERRRRVVPLHLVVQQDAAPQGQGEGDRVVGHLGRAVIGDVAYQDVSRGGGRAVELV